jgi:BTB/POZ domain
MGVAASQDEPIEMTPMRDPLQKHEPRSYGELQEIQRNEMNLLKRKRVELEEEQTASLPANEIVSINVGGEIIVQVHRHTLLLPAGSRFAALFSGRQEDHCVKDSEGRVFLDHDPELIRIILNYLRMKLIEDPSDPLNPPVIPNEKRKEWCCLLKHYGLTSFFAKRFSSLQVSDIAVVQDQDSLVSTQCVGEKLELTYVNAPDRFHFVACSPCLGAGTQASWKVTITKLPTQYCWLYLGLIGTTVALSSSYCYPTSFGWASNSQVYVAGQVNPSAGGWTSFSEGECLHFVLKETKLSMFSAAKNQRFTIDNVPSGDKFIHFNFYHSGTKLTLEPLSESEFDKLVS